MSQPSPSPAPAGRIIHIQPVTRIEGHARISIQLDEAGQVAEARLHLTTLFGFEKFLEGRPAEEAPRIVSRICGVCPWMHHAASIKAVDACLGVQPPPAGAMLRELMLYLAHIGDKILHFFFLAAPDFLLGAGADYGVRNVMGLAQAEPELAARVFQARQANHQMMEKFAGRVLHPVAMVSGGFSKPMSEAERQEMLAGSLGQLEFAKFALDFAKRRVFERLDLAQGAPGQGNIVTGFLGTVDAEGGLALYDGLLRLMRPDGGHQDFSPQEYAEHLGEHVEPWSQGKFPYARAWGEGFSMRAGAPKGIYRTNTLARLNVCQHIPTPLAQAELVEFRARFGRPAQASMLFHWARLIELLHVCEHVVALLRHPGITDPQVRVPAQPRAGRGVGCVEAPRGTLIHDYTTGEDGLIRRANLIVGSTHNLAPMNMSVRQAAQDVIRCGDIGPETLNRVEMALRAYDPCLSCAAHRLDGGHLVQMEVLDAQGKRLDAGW